MKGRYAGRILLGGLIAALLLVSVPVLAAEDYKTKADFLAEAREVIQEITVEEAFNDYFKPKKAGVVFLDVREADEVEAGHLPGAAWLARGLIEFKTETMFADRDAQMIIIYCKNGGRSALTAQTLLEMGYNVISMNGGFEGWEEKHYPVQRGAIASSEGGCG